MRAWTAWDGRVARRAAAIAALALALGWLVTAATDEGGLTWGVRAGRALPLAPACAAIGTWLALAAGRARGEDRALAALGRSPFERVLAAVCGGGGVAIAAAAALVLVGRVDVEGFYPRVERETRWVHDAGGFVSDDGVWRIADGGAPSMHPATEAPSVVAPRARLPVRARGAAALATALAGLALPLLVARARRRTVLVTALALVVTTMATVLGFQAAASARIPTLLVAVPPFVLLALAAASYGGWPWRTAKSRR